MNLKIISDQDCDVFIDESFVRTVPGDILTFIPVEKGEYLIKFKCKSLPNLVITKDLLIEYDKLERPNFQQEFLNSPELWKGKSLDVQQSKDGKWGIVLSHTSLWVIPAIYDNIDKTIYGGYEGKYAIIYKDGLCAIISITNNTIVVPFGDFESVTFESSQNYFKGVDSNGTEWVLNEKGRRIYNLSENREDIVLSFGNLLVIKNIQNDSCKALFPDGKPIDTIGEFSYIIPLASQTGSTYSPFYSPFYVVEHQHSGLIAVDPRTDTMEWIVPCEYEIKMFHKGEHILDEIITVLQLSELCYNGTSYFFEYYNKKGLLTQNITDGDGNTLVDTVYDNNGTCIFTRKNIEMERFIDDYALFWEEQKRYCLRSDGKVIGPYKFKSGYFNDYAEIVENEKYGLIDKNGRIVLPCSYDYIDWGDKYLYYTHEFYEDISWAPYLLIKKGDFFGIFDLYGEKELIPCTHYSIKILDGDWDIILAIFITENQTIVHYSDMSTIIIDEVLDQVTYQSGFLFIEKNNRKGVAKKDGKIFIAPCYDSIVVRDNSIGCCIENLWDVYSSETGRLEMTGLSIF